MSERPAAVDVIVVGGGPAGTATALWCAQHGLRVVLIEREGFPRHRPGETLPPGVEPLFRQLKVADEVDRAGFERHPGTRVSWAGPPRFDAFGADANGPWLGYQASRERLDTILLRAAVGAGVDVRQPERAGTPLLSGERVVGVVCGDAPISADWVVDAGGGRHWLARCLGIPRRTVSPRLVARYGYLQGDHQTPETPPQIVADKAGWTWTATVAPGLHNWTRLSFSSEDPPRDRPPDEFAGRAPIGSVRGADVTWRILERPAGPGFFCTGDAAAVLDPASSHGVMKAIMSGMMAAHAIVQCRRGVVSQDHAVRAYTGWLSGVFAADVAALTALYRSHPNPPSWVAEGSNVDEDVGYLGGGAA